MRLKYLCIIVFLIWVCIFIALLPTYRISAILEALDFSDKNLTQRELVELNLKDYLKKLHYLDNYPQIDFGKMADVHLDKNGYERVRFSWCNGDKYPDDRCEFWKLDKRLNFNYLMDLGSKICKNGRPIKNAEEIVENDEVLKLQLFYPWEQEHLIDEDGNFIENFIYMRFGDGANHSFDLFTDFVFISKNDIQLPIMYETKTKKFDIITPENRCYRWLLNSIFRDIFYQQKKSIYPFCYNYKKIIDENTDCNREYIFSFISIYDRGNNLDYKTIFYIKNLYYDKHETDILFNQYQNLKNQKNKINFNSQGEGSGSGY